MQKKHEIMTNDYPKTHKDLRCIAREASIITIYIQFFVINKNHRSSLTP